jgi:hypothetical protein
VSTSCRARQLHDQHRDLDDCTDEAYHGRAMNGISVNAYRSRYLVKSCEPIAYYGVSKSNGAGREKCSYIAYEMREGL